MRGEDADDESSTSSKLARARLRGRTAAAAAAAATQCSSRSWAEIIRFECTPAAAVGNSVISGHPAHNGYHNGIKHNASINVNNNRAVREREGGCKQGCRGAECVGRRASANAEGWRAKRKERGRGWREGRRERETEYRALSAATTRLRNDSCWLNTRDDASSSRALVRKPSFPSSRESETKSAIDRDNAWKRS